MFLSETSIVNMLYFTKQIWSPFGKAIPFCSSQVLGILNLVKIKDSLVVA